MWSAAAGAVLVALISAASCAPTMPKSDLRSGLSQETVRAKIEREPERIVSFALPEQPALQFTVYEYLLAPQKNWPEQHYWVLFGDDGLISFGEGGLREANARAYDSYFEWMAAQGHMPAAAAEQKYRAKLIELYGAELNPAVDEYLAYRGEVASEAAAGKVDAAAAGRLVYEKYVELEERNRTIDDPLLAPAEAKRFTVVAQMGLDQLSARLAQRPRVGAVNRSLACQSFANRLGAAGGCR